MSRPRPDDLIVAAWTDAFGVRRAVSPETRRRVHAAMRLPTRRHATRDDPILLARGGDRLGRPGGLVLEDGTEVGHVERLPRDLPVGYHRLHSRSGDRWLIVAPTRCPLPEGWRAWAWSIQLYAARSQGSWGIGDLGDLRSLATWAGAAGAGALLINPIGAPNPDPDPDPSPYFPSSRRFHDPLLLRIEAVPGAGDVPEIEALAAEARALNADRRIDRRRVLQLKRRALEAIWRNRVAARSDLPGPVDRFTAEIGPSLHAWATFAALSEELGADWRGWPEAFRHPGSPDVARFAAARADRVGYHAWVQWLIDEQLAQAATSGPRLVADLPVGFDPAGFDAWEWQDVLADGATIGAPPDAFNPAGQEWALPPFIPHRLRGAGLRPFVETVRAALRHAGGLRIDHALGLFRLWWVPPGVAPDQGAYVRYPVDELLAVLAIEASRAGALVIGEDLGTVERGVRRTLAAHRILSTRLVYFERRPPGRYPRMAQAAVTTHDLPTLAGTWDGSDLADCRRAGVAVDPGQLASLRARVARAGGIGVGADRDVAILAVHRALAASPACLVSATLEDALRVSERPNIPGTDRDRRANWSLALPVPVEQLTADPFVAQLAAALARE